MNNIRIVVIALILLILLYILLTSVNNNNNSNRYTVYGTMTCPYTVKMLDEVKHHGTVRFVDVSQPLGMHEFKSVSNSKSNGVPYTVDNKTGRHIVGFQKIIL